MEGYHMEENRKIRNQALAEHIIKNLNTRNITGYYADSKEEALKIALDLIPEGSSVGWGGSASIAEIGLKQAIIEGNYNVINRDICKSPEEKRQAELQCFDSDFFLASSNAITRDGILVNIDKFANRIAAIAYGPRNVILVIGMNKVVNNVENAVDRSRNEAASINAVRLNTETPCRNKGLCYDCKGAKSMCCQMLVTRSSGVEGRIKVILVNDALGF